MKYSTYFFYSLILCVIPFCLLINGCDNNDPANPDTYTAVIDVINNYSNEYRLIIGINDNLYNADTDQWSLSDGEIVIPSIPAGATETYTLELGTNSSLAKDWLLEYYNTFSGTWGVVLCIPDTDADGYVFEGNKSYSITIDATSNISIQMDT